MRKNRDDPTPQWIAYSLGSGIPRGKQGQEQEQECMVHDRSPATTPVMAVCANTFQEGTPQ